MVVTLVRGRGALVVPSVVHVHARRAIDASGSLAASVAARIEAAIERDVIGQEKAVEELLIAVLAGGRALLIGPPGVGKSRAARALARALGSAYVEIAGAPDRLDAPAPAGGVVTMDEVSRVPPSARLRWLDVEAASAIVLATHNPRETAEWPLTAFELDRFMLAARFDYPTAEEERAMARGGLADNGAEATVGLPELLQARADVADMPAASNIVEYAARLVRSTRPIHDGEAPAFVHELVATGAGPRATLALMTAARAHALVAGEGAVSLDDIDAVAPAVLRHRVAVSAEARRQGLTADDVISRLLPVARG